MCAVPAVDELKLTEHLPVKSVIQMLGLSEPRSVENEIMTPDLPSEVEAVIVED